MNYRFVFRPVRQSKGLKISFIVGVLALVFAMSPLSNKTSSYMFTIIVLGGIGILIQTAISFFKFKKENGTELVFEEEKMTIISKGDKQLSYQYTDLQAFNIVKKNVNALNVKKTIKLMTGLENRVFFLEDYGISDSLAEEIAKHIDTKRES